MVSVPVYQFDTGKVGSAEVDETCFGEEIRWRVLRDAVVMYQANRRVGTHAAKTRAEVAGSKKKPWRQKGTGRARAGTKKSPIWRGGGVAFAKKPRDFGYKMPRKALREALRSALLGKLLDGEVALVENMVIAEPKTKEIVKVLRGLEVDGSALVVHPGGEGADAVVKSTRNIARTRVRAASELNAYDVVTHERLVLTKDGLDQLIERVGHGDS